MDLAENWAVKCIRGRGGVSSLRVSAPRDGSAFDSTGGSSSCAMRSCAAGSRPASIVQSKAVNSRLCFARRTAGRMYFVSTTEEMEAIGPSPPASPGPGVEEEQSTAEKAVVDLDQLEDPAPPAKKSVTHTQETKFRREFPYFTTLKTCLAELGKNKVNEDRPRQREQLPVLFIPGSDRSDPRKGSKDTVSAAFPCLSCWVCLTSVIVSRTAEKA